MKLFELDYSKTEIASLIKQDCEKWLKEIGKDNMAFRGERTDQLFFKQKPHPNRIPLSMRLSTHKALVKAFSELGFDANRQNSFFAFGNKLSTYGNFNYGIFPIGNFTFTWSPAVNDLFISINDDIFFKSKPEKVMFVFSNSNEDIKPKYVENIIKKHLDNHGIKFKFGKHAIKPRAFMFDTDIIMNDIKKLEQITKDITDDLPQESYFDFSLDYTDESADIGRLKDWIIEKKYSNKDLESAIVSHNEIMIKCESAYFVRYSVIPYAELDIIPRQAWLKKDN